MEKRPVIAEISIIPLGTNSTSLSGYVASCLEVLKDKKGIRYQLTPTCTVVQAELEEIFDVVRQMHEVPFSQGILRVITTVKIDDRRDKEESLEKRVKAVQEKLN